MKPGEMQAKSSRETETDKTGVNDAAPNSPVTQRPFVWVVRAGAVLALLGLTAGLVWWMGPWSAGFRYKRMDMVSLRQVLDRSPEDALAWRTLGLRLAKEGDVSLAEPVLEKAYVLNPKDGEVATSLSELLLTLGRDAEAFQLLKMTTAQSPQSAPANLALGRLYFKRKSYLHASEAFQAVIKANPQMAEGWYALALCYRETQQVAKGQEAIAEAIRLAPTQGDYLALKGSLDASVGNIDAGLAALERAAQLAPTSLQVQVTYANLLLTHHRNDQDLNQAEQVIGLIEQIDPKYPALAYQYGELKRLRGKWQEAVRYLEQAIKAAPDHDEIYYSLAQTYQRLNRTAEADKVLAIYHRRQELHRQISALRLRIESQPEKIEFYASLADAQEAFGDLIGALDTLNAAIKIAPTQTALQTRRAQLQQQLKTLQQGKP